MNATTALEHGYLHPAADQPYARQLAAGFARLRFAPALEAEYRQNFAREQRRPAVIFGMVALTIWAGFAISDLVRLDVFQRGVPSIDLWVLLLSRWTALLAIGAFFVSLQPRGAGADRLHHLCHYGPGGRRQRHDL